MSLDLDDRGNELIDITGPITVEDMFHARRAVAMYAGIKLEDVQNYTVVYWAVRMIAEKGQEWLAKSKYNQNNRGK